MTAPRATVTEKPRTRVELAMWPSTRATSAQTSLGSESRPPRRGPQERRGEMALTAPWQPAHRDVSPPTSTNLRPGSWDGTTTVAWCLGQSEVTA
jgi:hypothetical protein